MYTIKTENSFDSAHFLSGYKGKCSNIHGHRWRVIIEVKSQSLSAQVQTRGMLCDFVTLKNDVKKETEKLDHTLIIEENSLKPATLAALADEGFKITAVPFRPTAENFSKYFYNKFKALGYNVKQAQVYETPNNCASYSED